MSETRRFGLWQSTAFVVGTVVGTGIYLKPSSVAQLLQSPVQVYLVWLLGGVFVTSGAVVYSQLAQVWPVGGGAYIYLQRVYGSWASSLLLAADVFLARPAAVGALATGFGLIWGLTSRQGLWVAVILLLVLTLLQLAGAEFQGRGQVLLTILQLVPLILILLIWFWSEPSQAWHAAAVSSDSPRWAGAFLAILWAYDGWYNLTNLGGEVWQPRRVFPRALVGGMFFVTVLYLLLNGVLLTRLGMGEVAAQPVAYLALFSFWDVSSLWLGILLKLALSFALLATLNGTLACGARMIVAGSRESVFREDLGHTPDGPKPTLCFALLCLGLLALFGGVPSEFSLFDNLSELTAVVVTMLSGLTVTCIFHRSHMSVRVTVLARCCAVFYLLVTVSLLLLMIQESNLLALWGTLTVAVLGTVLRLNKKPFGARG